MCPSHWLSVWPRRQVYHMLIILSSIYYGGLFVLVIWSSIMSQLAGYLLVSASSVAVPVIQQTYNGNSLWNATVVSICMSFASFLVIAATALLSGYKLCKRIMWWCFIRQNQNATLRMIYSFSKLDFKKIAIQISLSSAKLKVCMYYFNFIY